MSRQTQQGMATLAVALVLLMAATIMTFAMAKAALLEQRMSANELRAAEARHRAEAALEAALLELGRRRLPEGDWQALIQDLESTALDAPVDLHQDAASGEGYQYRIELQRLAAVPDLIEVMAQARAESGASATLHQFAQLQWPLSSELPPLVVDGCISSGFGGAQLFPGGEDNLSLATTLAHPGAACLDTDGLSLEGGAIATGFAGAGNLWDALFALSKAELRERAEREQAAVEAGELAAGERSYYWINEPGEQWHQELQGFEPGMLGAPDHPLWLLFDAAADCPPLPAGITLYGILYYETGESGACDAGGWGNANLYGSILVEGDLQQLAGGGRFFPYPEAGQGGLRDNLPPLQAARLPGTWRDF